MEWSEWRRAAANKGKRKRLFLHIQRALHERHTESAELIMQRTHTHIRTYTHIHTYLAKTNAFMPIIQKLPSRPNFTLLPS